MADHNPIPQHLVRRKFKKLAALVGLVLQAFKLYPPSPSHCSKYASRSRPSLEQLGLQDARQKVSERILQRLRRTNLLSDEAYLANTLLGLSSEIKEMLSCSPWNRNPSDLDKAQIELENNSVFQDYPIHVQKALCKVAWYQHLEDGRVIIKAGHKATVFCILLSGKVQVNHSEMRETTLQEGDTFGDDEFVEDKRRMRTYFVLGSAELLVISKSDYLDLGLRQARKSYQRAKPYAFCRSISILKYWPLSDLEGRPDVFKIFSCRPNHVIVKDSQKSNWIYVIMTGTCRVVKRFVDTSIRRASLQTHPGEGRKMSFKGGTLPGSPLLNEQSHPQRKKGLKQSYTTGCLQQQTVDKIINQKPAPSIPRKQFLVQLDFLHPKDIFGLSTLVHESEPSVTLISNGAEVVVLSKAFILLHLTDSLKIKLRRQVIEYPSEEAMRKRIRDHYTWNTFKHISSSKRKL